MSYTYRGIDVLPDYTEGADVEYLARSLIDGLRAGKTESAYVAAHTLVAGDVGNLITCSGTWALTVPPNATTAFTYAPCTIMPIQNIFSGTITITPGAGVTILGADLTLGAYEAGTLTKFLINTWIFAKGGGVPFARATGGTVTTYTASGVDYEVHAYTATSNLTVSKAGLAGVLPIGGGGGGGGSGAHPAIGYCGGGGGGGGAHQGTFWLPAGTLAVLVGAGGAGGIAGAVGTMGNLSGLLLGANTQNVGGIYGPGGGPGIVVDSLPVQGNGITGGGGGARDYSGGLAIAGGTGQPPLGLNGGAGIINYGAGGGGGAAGSAPAATSTLSPGGAGFSSTLQTGSALTYGGGGGGGRISGTGLGTDGGGNGGVGAAGSNGTANRGGGGGGAGGTYAAGGAGGNGGSGAVYVRIRLS